MRHVRVLIVAVVAAAAAGKTAGAQAPIPIRKIGPILATSTEDVGEGVTVRGTSDGHVLVAAGARQRVYAFDSTLTHFTIVIDSGSGTAVQGTRSFAVIPYLGDSTLLPDQGAGALLVLDATGKQLRSMAPPKAQDLVYLGNPAGGYGRPGVDSKGRLIYRTNAGPKFGGVTQPPGAKLKFVPFTPDSQPIVRGDFDTRTVDTLAWMKTPAQGRLAMEQIPDLAGGPPTMVMHFLANPFVTQDEWTLLSDGTIALVRVHDYHVDWVDPDGSRRSSPKMPFDWRRYTDAERQQRIDSLMHLEEASKKSAPVSPNRPQFKRDLRIVPDSEFPAFWPPVESGSVIADLDAHLWILPTTSTNAANGFTYDVVDRKGEVVSRVQLPKDNVLVGFGPHDTVYLAKTEGKNTFLARVRLAWPAR